jgi:hypothetical protein
MRAWNTIPVRAMPLTISFPITPFAPVTMNVLVAISFHLHFLLDFFYLPLLRGGLYLCIPRAFPRSFTRSSLAEPLKWPARAGNSPRVSPLPTPSRVLPHPFHILPHPFHTLPNLFHPLPPFFLRTEFLLVVFYIFLNNNIYNIVVALLK